MNKSDEDFDKLLKEGLPIIDAMDAPPAPVPPETLKQLEAARAQLFKEQSRLRQPQRQSKVIWPFSLDWQWQLGFAAAAAIIVVAAVFYWPASTLPMIQVAMLDTVGGSRGTPSDPAIALQQTWQKSKVETFTASGDSKQWQDAWPANAQQPVVKVFYNRNQWEVQVSIHRPGKPSVEKTFPVQKDQDLPVVLKAVQAFVEEQLK